MLSLVVSSRLPVLDGPEQAQQSRAQIKMDLLIIGLIILHQVHPKVREQNHR